MADKETPAVEAEATATSKRTRRAAQPAQPEVTEEVAPEVTEDDDDENHPHGRLVTFGKIQLRVR